MNTLHERKKSRALKKAFKSKGQDAFPKITSDDDIVFVSSISKEKALQLLKKACHGVSNFHPEYMKKAIESSDDQIFGVFNKHDKHNVLALATAVYDKDLDAMYLHEMTGFIKGGYGQKLIAYLMKHFKRIYGQIVLTGSGTDNDPYAPNEKLRDKVYAKIPGLKFYRVEDSIWNCPADFLYYGISNAQIKEFLEKTYGSKEVQIDEDEGISNNDIYLANMSKSFADKAWFLKYIPKDVTSIVDFGGGTGDFAKFCMSKKPNLVYAVIDNNSSFSDKAKENGFVVASSLQELKNANVIDFSKSCLNMSSVIHEVYSYADLFYDDVGVFWTELKKCNFKCISIRDMSYDENAMRNAPINAICWVYENVLMSDSIKYKGIPFREIIESFEDVWGKICDPDAKKVNGKNLFHFLIKYRYQENWSREVQENYLPVSKEKLASILTSMGYSFKHKESSKLAFYGKCWKKDLKLGIPDNNGYKRQFYAWLLTLDTHIKWFLEKKDNTLSENKSTYLRKYRDEDDVNTVVEMFQAIRSRLSAPQNDIDWWIKKPFNELKSFVQNFDMSNKRQRRDANYKKQAIDNGAKLLDTKDGYEIWYVPIYDAMVAIGRFYKGKSAKWCVASDDPDFWFDNHEDSEFVVLVREHPKNDEFDKIAIEMMNHGRYYSEDDIIPWDLENNDRTFTNDSLMHEAWLLFKDNGETREQYFG